MCVCVCVGRGIKNERETQSKCGLEEGRYFAGEQLHASCANAANAPHAVIELLIHEISCDTGSRCSQLQLRYNVLLHVPVYVRVYKMLQRLVTLAEDGCMLFRTVHER